MVPLTNQLDSIPLCLRLFLRVQLGTHWPRAKVSKGVFKGLLQFIRVCTPVITGSQQSQTALGTWLCDGFLPCLRTILDSDERQAQSEVTRYLRNLLGGPTEIPFSPWANWKNRAKTRQKDPTTEGKACIWNVLLDKHAIPKVAD